MKNLGDYKIYELKEMGEDFECYSTLEKLCCQENVSVMCEMNFFDNKPNYIADVKDMAEALIDIKEERMNSEGKQHILGCDEYHGHHAPKCCSRSCWCQSEYNALEGKSGLQEICENRKLFDEHKESVRKDMGPFLEEQDKKQAGSIEQAGRETF